MVSLIFWMFWVESETHIIGPLISICIWMISMKNVDKFDHLGTVGIFAGLLNIKHFLNIIIGFCEYIYYENLCTIFRKKFHISWLVCCHCDIFREGGLVKIFGRQNEGILGGNGFSLTSVFSLCFVSVFLIKFKLYLPPWTYFITNIFLPASFFLIVSYFIVHEKWFILQKSNSIFYSFEICSFDFRVSKYFS